MTSPSDPRTPLEAAVTTLDGDCWVWNGIINSSGYPRTKARGEVIYVHRLVVGAKPGEHAHHICRNPACVNPAHLELLPSIYHHNGRHAEDTERCRNGHPYTEENLYFYKGKRHCRACRLANNRKVAVNRVRVS